MEICPLDAKPGQGKCKDLYLVAPNAKDAKDFKGVKEWYLPGIDKWTGGNSGNDGPRFGALGGGQWRPRSREMACGPAGAPVWGAVPLPCRADAPPPGTPLP